MPENNKQTLENIGREQARESYIYSTFDGMSEENFIEQGLGIAIAQGFEWDISRIVRTFLAALEDANAHTFGAEVERLAREDGLL